MLHKIIFSACKPVSQDSVHEEAAGNLNSKVGSFRLFGDECRHLCISGIACPATLTVLGYS